VAASASRRTRHEWRISTPWVAGSNPAGIATDSDDQSIAWHDLRFVLPAEPCCAALQVSDSDSKALPGPTNRSTQHERNTTFPPSFASDWDTDTIGLIVLAVAPDDPFCGRQAVPVQEVPAGVNWNLVHQVGVMPSEVGTPVEGILMLRRRRVKHTASLEARIAERVNEIRVKACPSLG
jgi:hypothetical protein